MTTPSHTEVDRVVLVSQSPRRRRLLSLLGLPFETASVDTPEELDSPLASEPARLAELLAAEKAVAARAEGLADRALVLTFDTIVVHRGKLLGKPEDAEHARRMLRSLAGEDHEVVTGVAVLCPGDPEPRTFSASTVVAMKDLTDRQIEEWMESGEYLGCAGAYNIEGQVAEVGPEACYQNVAGLPLCHLYRELTGEDAPSCLPSQPIPPVAGCEHALSRTCPLGAELCQG
jgi:septum formation protein